MRSTHTHVNATIRSTFRKMSDHFAGLCLLIDGRSFLRKGCFCKLNHAEHAMRVFLRVLNDLEPSRVGSSWCHGTDTKEVNAHKFLYACQNPHCQRFFLNGYQQTTVGEYFYGSDTDVFCDDGLDLVSDEDGKRQWGHVEHCLSGSQSIIAFSCFFLLASGGASVSCRRPTVLSAQHSARTLSHSRICPTCCSLGQREQLRCLPPLDLFVISETASPARVYCYCA